MSPSCCSFTSEKQDHISAFWFWAAWAAREKRNLFGQKNFQCLEIWLKDRSSLFVQLFECIHHVQKLHSKGQTKKTVASGIVASLSFHSPSGRCGLWPLHLLPCSTSWCTWRHTKHSGKRTGAWNDRHWAGDASDRPRTAAKNDPGASSFYLMLQLLSFLDWRYRFVVAPWLSLYCIYRHGKSKRS